MRRITQIAAVTSLVALVATGCGGSDEEADTGASPSVSVELSDTAMSETDAAAVDAAVNGAWTGPLKSGFPAVWVGVWDPEKGYVEKAYGDAETGGSAATADDWFRIGSISKTYLATVVLELVDEGKLSLDDTVQAADPALAKKFPTIKDITIEQLLGMTSGIPDYLNVPDADIMPRLTEDPTTEFTADELITAGISGGLKPAGTPGYSTTNIIIAQEIAQDITGQSIQDLVTDKVTAPLGMKTAFPAWNDASLPTPGTHGYLNDLCVTEITGDGGTAKAGQDTTDWNLTSSQSGGGGYSDLHDLGIWAASMSGNALLTDDLAAQRLKTTELPEGVDYGLGIFQMGDWYGHSGEVFGWEAIELHAPESGATMVVATNACAGATTFMLNIVNALYPGSMPQ